MATIITATIGTTKLKMCEIDNSLRVPTIQKAITVDLPQGYASDGRLLDIDGLAEFIKATLIKEQIMTREVIFILKSSKVVYKEVYTPVLKDKKLKEFIMANASDYFPMDINEYIIAEKQIALVDGQEGEKQLRMGLYAASKEMVEGYYTLAEKVGFTIRKVESYNNSTVSFLNKQVDAETSVVVHIHDDSTTINIYKNNILELQRNIPYGRDLVVQAVVEDMGISEEEATNLLSTKGLIHSTFDGHAITESLKPFTNAVIRVVDFYTSRSAENTIEKVYLTGESMNILGLESLFVNEFFHNTEQIKKFRYIAVASNYRFEAAMIAKYISCLGGIYEPVHFQSELELQKRKKDKNTAYFAMALVVAILGAVVAIAVPVIQRLSLMNEIDSYEKKIQALRTIEIVVDDFYVSQDKVTDVDNFLAITTNPNDQIIEMIQALEKGMPSHISIKSLAVENGNVSIAGTTSTKETVAKFITQLNSMPGVTNVFVSSCIESVDANGLVSTTFQLSFAFNSDIATYLNDGLQSGEEESKNPFEEKFEQMEQEYGTENETVEGEVQ